MGASRGRSIEGGGLSGRFQDGERLVDVTAKCRPVRMRSGRREACCILVKANLSADPRSITREDAGSERGGNESPRAIGATARRGRPDDQIVGLALIYSEQGR